MPVWKRSNPPCEAHKLLDTMFADNKIFRDSSPANVHKLSPEFQKYSLNVFRTAFNELRKKYGVELKKASAETSGDNFASGSGFTPRPPLKRQQLSDISDEGETHLKESIDSQIIHHNQPVLMEVYVDPVTQNKKVIVVVSLPGGANDVHFSLVGSDPRTSTARISYSWPTIGYDIDMLFEKPITVDKLPACHPKILALKQGLQRARSSIDEIPRGFIELHLPIPVLTVADSVSRSRKKAEDGSTALIVELRA